MDTVLKQTEAISDKLHVLLKKFNATGPEGKVAPLEGEHKKLKEEIDSLVGKERDINKKLAEEFTANFKGLCDKVRGMVAYWISANARVGEDHTEKLEDELRAIKDLCDNYIQAIDNIESTINNIEDMGNEIEEEKHPGPPMSPPFPAKRVAMMFLKDSGDLK